MTKHPNPQARHARPPRPVDQTRPITRALLRQTLLLQMRSTAKLRRKGF
jgi:hypothetical protein